MDFWSRPINSRCTGSGDEFPYEVAFAMVGEINRNVHGEVELESRARNGCHSSVPGRFSVEPDRFTKGRSVICANPDGQ
jgi:hypothetical protein